MTTWPKSVPLSEDMALALRGCIEPRLGDLEDGFSELFDGERDALLKLHGTLTQAVQTNPFDPAAPRRRRGGSARVADAETERTAVVHERVEAAGPILIVNEATVSVDGVDVGPG